MRARSVLRTTLFCFFALFSAGHCAEPARENADPQLRVADQFMELFATGKCPAACALFDAKVTAAVPAPALEKIRAALIARNGALLSHSRQESKQEGEFRTLLYDCHFQQQDCILKIVVGKDRHISGLWILPPAPRRKAGPVSLPGGKEEEVQFAADPRFRLSGSLTIPDATKAVPAVVLVHGSGPQDRDETFPPNKPFRDLAYGLTAQGILVLRYDKRTHTYAAAMSKEMKLTVKEEVLDDAAAAVAFLRTRKEVNPEQIFLLGHSLGGMLAPRIAAQTSGIKGLILLAAPTLPLQELLVKQVTYLSGLNGRLSAEQQETIRQLTRQKELVESAALTASTPATELPLQIPASYWLDLRTYNPVQTATKLPIPLLILQGKRDYQVTVENFKAWQAGLAEGKDITFRLYEDLNHLFLPGKGRSTPQEYQTPGTFSPDAIADIAAWIKAR